MKRGNADLSQQWCILRTSAARTLKLAMSLTSTGFDVWTPAQTVVRRRGPARDRVEQPAPITPTFVFARADRVADLIVAINAAKSPHPPFSMFRYRGTIPTISDASLAALRDEERRCQRRQMKAQRRSIEPGTSIRLTEGAFAGMTGVVEQGNGKEAVVNFGSGFIVTIATYLLETDVLHTVNKPGMGIAA